MNSERAEAGTQCKSSTKWNLLLFAWSDQQAFFEEMTFGIFIYWSKVKMLVKNTDSCLILTQMAPRSDLQVFKVVLTRRHTKEPGRLVQRADSLEKTQRLGTIEGRRKRGCQRIRWLEGIIDSGCESEQTQGDRRTGKPGVLQSTGSQSAGHD